MSRGGAPTSPPPQVRIIYGDITTTPAGPAGLSYVEWAGFYAISTDEIAGGDVPAALARLGLSYSAGVFTALTTLVLAVQVDVVVVASPGGACTLKIGTPGFMSDEEIAITNPNTLGRQYLRTTLAMLPGENFHLTRTCTNASDTPTSYAEIQIVRLA